MITLYALLKLHWAQELGDCIRISKLLAELRSKDQVQCRRIPDGYYSPFKLYKKKEYTLIREYKNFDDAKKDCIRRGMRLATVYNEEEQQAVAKLAEEGKGSDLLVWLGGSDRQEKGHHVWESSGEPFTFTAWLVQEGEPDHRKDKKSGQIQHCTGIYPDHGKWRDFWCSIRRHFICERLS